MIDNNINNNGLSLHFPFIIHRVCTKLYYYDRMRPCKFKRYCVNIIELIDCKIFISSNILILFLSITLYVLCYSKHDWNFNRRKKNMCIVWNILSNGGLAYEILNFFLPLFYQSIFSGFRYYLISVIVLLMQIFVWLIFV